MYFKIIVLFFSIFTVYVLMVEGLHSYQLGMFTVNQMHTRYGFFFKGLPFISHGAMLGDLLVITPCLICILAFYGHEWSWRQCLFYGLIGYLLNTIMHIFYAWNSGAKNAEPDCIVWGGSLTSAGWFHFIFMGNGLTIVLLFYFATTRIQPLFMGTVTALFIIHLIVANNVILSLTDPLYWSPRPHRDPKVWVQIAIGSAVLLYRTRALLMS